MKVNENLVFGFWNYKKNSMVFLDLVWILTREQYPSEDVKKVINDELDKHNLDKSKLVTL